METNEGAAGRVIADLLRRKRSPADTATLRRLQLAYPEQAAASKAAVAREPSDEPKPSKVRVTLTADERDTVRALAVVSYGSAWSSRRFVRALRDVVEREGEAATTTEGGREWIRVLAHRYRRQVGRCMASDCAACAGKAA